MEKMSSKQLLAGILCGALLAAGGCSREQSDWEKARAANTSDSYELFVKKYPSGAFTAQAQARLKELDEQRDYQKARDTDTPDAYQAFIRQYPEGKFTDEARIRLENFSLAQAPTGAPADAEAPPSAATPGASTPGASTPGTETSGAATSSAATPSAATSGSPGTATSPEPTGADHAGSAAPSKKDSRGYTIQLGAFKSGKAAATAHWAVLEKKYPALLKGLTPKVRPSTTAAGKLFRLQVASLSRARAHAICKDLKAASQACIVLPHAGH
jgi:cell division septation protein DedD